MYAKRGEAEEDFQKALRRGMIPLVFGEYGVGKTSMARRCVLDAEKQKRLVNIESVAGQSVSDILKRCLETIGYTITTEITTQQTESATTKVTGGVEIPFKAFKASLTGENSNTAGETALQKAQFAVSSPTDSKVIDLCEQHQLVLLLDELHKATPDFVEQITLLIKTYANKNCKNFRIILLGTSSDASRLVRRDPGIDRLLQEIPLKAMSTAESRFIIEKGMTDLKIDIEKSIADKIVKTSSGSPSLVQYLCLEIAEKAFARAPRTASMDDFKSSLTSYVNKRARRLDDLYLKAIETFGQKRYRKQILRAMAEMDNDYVTMEQLCDSITKQLGEDIPSTALSGPLRQLKETTYGPVLKDVERGEGGERVQNYTTFVDPAMKAFIRMKIAGEET
ncbi:AAA family ATPase [Corallococcus sp. ZKHCc1 1396]|uniref:AAA family ATPase n=1 Tax=Corallococcus soli TaxID=2710757 RepID=A0ABR9PUA4_9BACT|nr:AAA family ATPase [Corallococcus soli]